MKDEFKILVVDDDEAIRESLADILIEKEFKVDIASDGYKAIEMIEYNEYLVILMDIMMPIIDGVEVFKRIKKIKPLSKAIFITGYANEDLVVYALKEGAVAVLYKPVAIDELFQKIELCVVA